jgi:hypothetical protein
MGLISTIALFLPIAFILILRMGRYRTFPILITYYAIAIINNFLGEGYIPASSDIVKYWSLVNNLLDAPLMLLFLTYFCTSPIQARRMRVLILSFVLFEVAIVLLRGVTKEAITIILAPGLAIVFSFCLYFFIRKAKKAITHRKATGKALIIASLLFAYGCFTILYLMYYVFQTHLIDGKLNREYLEDTYLVFFFVTTFSSLLMCAGIIIESKRVQKLHELKLTRKELSQIYSGTEKAAPLRTALLDFKRD